jgi:hypothetical protein
MSQLGEAAPSRLVWITGLETAGLGLVARLLAPLGATICADEELEALSDALLAAQGGAWDLPPALPPGWERAPALLPLRARAAALLRAHATAAGSAPAAGFKDPRALLTLPFWRLLRPDLRLVVCLRNPLEVARSLARRNGTSPAAALHLWERSYRQLRASTTPDQRLLVHHDALHHDPAAELARVLAWLGLAATPAQLAAACTQLRPALRHQRVSPAELLASPVSDPLLTLYLDLCAEAGPTQQLALAEQLAEPPGPVLGPDQHDQRRVTLDVEQLMRRLQSELATPPGYGHE